MAKRTKKAKKAAPKKRRKAAPKKKKKAYGKYYTTPN